MKGPPSLNHASLEHLQHDDARKVMDTVDRLRKTGLSAIVQLPQIVTVGDQSSGKSSVLEAITGVPFPRKENLCIRFATQIVLRRARTESVSVAIIPDKLRPANERARLSNIQLRLDDFAKLGELMDTATEAMGLKPGHVSENVQAFSRDVLNIEISRPTRPHLTLVDLPGLIHSENKQQTRQDVELITNLVEEYIKEKRTIVLAIVSAKNDIANQIVLHKTRELGAANRTLGVITKVDVLEPDTENESAWLDLAQNKDVHFSLGWAMLRNRGPKEMNFTLQDRNAKEADFFARGSYRQMDRKILGVDNLRVRLSNMLYEHLTQELPSLRAELVQKREATTAELELLGVSRDTAEKRLRYLMDIGQKFERVAHAGVQGMYEGEFFLSIDTDKPITNMKNISRIRAIVQYANLQFASQMRQYGSKYRWTSTPEDFQEFVQIEAGDRTIINEYKYAEVRQVKVTYEQALDWVAKTMERTRGVELPGNFNPALITSLFHEQSSYWSDLAADHIQKISEVCSKFVEALLKHVAPLDIGSKIMANIVEPALKARTERARVELGMLHSDRLGHPITYNHYYTTTIQKIRNKKHTRKMEKLLRESVTPFSRDLPTPPPGTPAGPSFGKNTPITAAAAGPALHTVDLKLVASKFTDHTIQEDMNKFSAEDALICQMAYYKDELKYFINAVTKQVVERHLVSNLATDLISAVKFAMMDPADINYLAGEAPGVMQEREQLQKKLEMLEEGIKQFRTASGGLF